MSSLLDRFWYIIKTPRLLVTWTLLCSICSALQVRVSSDGLAVEGRETRLNCTIEGYNHRFTLYWERIINGSSSLIIDLPYYFLYDIFSNIQSPYYDRFSVKTNNFHSVLVINNTNRTDDGIYTCEFGFSASNVTLNVVYLDLPTLITRDLKVNESEDVTFTCSLGEGNPKPRIIWLKDSEELDVSNAVKYPASNLSLVISKVTKCDEGKYKCKAENEVLTRESRETATLTLNDLDSLSTPCTPTTELVLLSTSTPAALECETSASSVTALVVGMIFLGIIIGIVLSSSVYILFCKMKTSSKATQATTNENQAETYMEYGGELKTENQTYQDLRKKDDQFYVNINAKKGKRKY